MAVPANSTRTSVVHRRTDADPRSFPERYAIYIDGHKMLPAIEHNTNHVFSTTLPVRKGDIVALWRRPDTLLPGEYQSVAYRLSSDLPAGVILGDASRARTPDDPMIYVEATNPPERLAYRASEIIAIHKWLGEIHPKQETFHFQPQEREANKETVAVSSNVPTEQAELSLLAPTGDGPITMSSREIAELLGDRHDSVKRTIERLVARDVFASPPMVDFKNINGVTGKEYRLDKRSSLIVVAQLSPEFTAKVVDRWQELEEAIKQPQPTAPQFPIPQTFAEALMLAANQAAQIEHQKGAIAEKNAQIADMREDVDALDRIAGADDLFGLREAVAMLQTTQNKFVAWLQQNGWAYRQTGTRRLLAYADKRKAGYATNKAEPYTKKDGSEGVGETLKFYPAGIVKLAKLLSVTLTDGDLRRIHGNKGRAA